MISLNDMIVRLLWAALLGSAIGVERSLRRRPAGLRTGLCVAVGAAFFTILSIEIARRTGDGSTTRIASNIVQGIGFLGAGVILRDRGGVTGLTTAATIFVVAAMGMGAGAGLFRASGFTCLLVLFALVFLVYVENWFGLKPRYMLFRISTDPNVDLVSEVHQVFSSMGIALDNFQVSMAGQKNLIQFDADLSHRKQEKIFAALTRPDVTIEMLPVERQPQA
ncbi:MAG: putative Mg2+ transporter-C (MgtC) family protein [Acidobacteriaceae bacterium]|jgi:putative Mg2+ transporter-C (MgtC) family protein|nr:putative Mg2+ transporter-C (MgtC) family protein [Acidobacteriaceae bacterium]